MPHLLPAWMDLSTWEDLWTSTVVTLTFTVTSIVISHKRLHKKLRNSQAKMEDLMNPNTPGGLGELKDKLDESPQSTAP